jgi:hypothetical protein
MHCLFLSKDFAYVFMKDTGWKLFFPHVAFALPWYQDDANLNILFGKFKTLLYSQRDTV